MEVADRQLGRFRASVSSSGRVRARQRGQRLISTGRYQAQQLLDYTAVDLISDGVDEAMRGRDEFSFSVNIKFGGPAWRRYERGRWSCGGLSTAESRPVSLACGRELGLTKRQVVEWNWPYLWTLSWDLGRVGLPEVSRIKWSSRVPLGRTTDSSGGGTDEFHRHRRLFDPAARAVCPGRGRTNPHLQDRRYGAGRRPERTAQLRWLRADPTLQAHNTIALASESSAHRTSFAPIGYHPARDHDRSSLPECRL